MELRLYNKYRPSFFRDVIGEDRAVSYLLGLLKTGNFKRVSEIILYSNVGGVSKTTLAKIYAKAVFCDALKDGEPCGECNSCKAFDLGKYVDYVELDGAEYGTVESVAPIIQLASTYPFHNNKFRVVVFNEFQRASKQAQTKFLDLLEFGKNKTIFIFTTTEIDAILQPLRSRCFCIEILPLKTSDMVRVLKEVCRRENIFYKEDVLKRIAEEARGSVREALRVVDLCNLSFGEVTEERERKEDYALILNLFRQAVMPNFKDFEGVSRIASKALYVDMCRVLIDLVSVGYGEGTKWLRVEEAGEAYKALKLVLRRIVKEVLTYKPNTAEDFYLLLQSFEDLGSKVSLLKEERIGGDIVRGRNFIKEEVKSEKTVGDLLKQFGFSIVTQNQNAISPKI